MGEGGRGGEGGGGGGRRGGKSCSLDIPCPSAVCASPYEPYRDQLPRAPSLP